MSTKRVTSLDVGQAHADLQGDLYKGMRLKRFAGRFRVRGTVAQRKNPHGPLMPIHPTGRQPYGLSAASSTATGSVNTVLEGISTVQSSVRKAM